MQNVGRILDKGARDQMEIVKQRLREIADGGGDLGLKAMSEMVLMYARQEIPELPPDEAETFREVIGTLATFGLMRLTEEIAREQAAASN